MRMGPVGTPTTVTARPHPTMLSSPAAALHLRVIAEHRIGSECFAARCVNPSGHCPS